MRAERICGRANEVSPDSEQIEPACAKHRWRNSVSVEQIQDRAEGGNGEFSTEDPFIASQPRQRLTSRAALILLPYRLENRLFAGDFED